MSQKPVSITDIARKVGVSTTTVSRVLNDAKGDIPISAKTRKLVLETASRLGYQRNPFASALRTSRSGIVGAVSPNVSGTYVSVLGHHLQLAAHKLGIELLIGSTRVESEKIAGQLSILQSQIFDGVLFLCDHPYHQKLLNHEARFSKPYVHVMSESEQAAPVVAVDNEIGVALALDHLTELGHTRIAFIGSPAWPGDRQRMRVYKAYLQAHGLPFHEELVSDLGQIPYTPEMTNFVEQIRHAATEHAYRLVAQKHRPTAIFCASDGYAADVLKAVYRLGLRVPDDISIVGYGDQHEALITYPELTTVRIPNDVIAEAALKLLMDLIEDPESEHLLQTRIYVAPELIIRNSTAPAAS